MKSAAMRTALPALALGLALIVPGCGSGTRTVSVASSPTPLTTTDTTTSSGTHTHTQTSTRTTKAVVTSTVTATTRIATAPAFAQQGGEGGDLAAATALVKAHGYTPVNTSDYRPAQTLRVLIATRTGSGDGYDQRAFFFVGGKYIGTDASTPSAAVSVVRQSDTEITLAYPLYRSHDPLCCPSGGRTEVRFQLDNGRLVALDPIPPNSSPSGLSRG